jgi:hypothetical protein
MGARSFVAVVTPSVLPPSMRDRSNSDWSDPGVRSEDDVTYSSSQDTPTTTPSQTPEPNDACYPSSGISFADDLSNGLSTQSSVIGMDQEGVVIPCLLQTLFDLEYIPFSPLSFASPDQKGLSARPQHYESSLPTTMHTGTPERSSIDGTESRAHGGMTPQDLPSTPVPLSETPSPRHALDGARPEQAVGKGNARKKRLRSAFGKGFKVITQAPRIRPSSTKSKAALPGTTHSKSALAEEQSSSLASPLRTDLLRKIQAQQQTKLESQQRRLGLIAEESKSVQRRARELECSIGSVQGEIRTLQRALEQSYQKLQTETTTLASVEAELQRLEGHAIDVLRKVGNTMSNVLDDCADPSTRNSTATTASVLSGSPAPIQRQRSATDEGVAASRREKNIVSPLPETGLAPLAVRVRANTEPRPSLHRHSSSFMRANDLDILLPQGKHDYKNSVPITSPKSSIPSPNKFSKGDFLLIEENLALILEKLVYLGYTVATDESERFEPTRETKKLLAKYPNLSNASLGGDWPVRPWHAPQHGDVLVWTGGVPHKGFGHDWPVAKARGIVETSPESLVEFLLDSKQIKRYNKMSQGREDVLVLQKGVHTSAKESEYAVAGDAKIMRALVKPRLLPKTIEMLSLWHTRHLANAPGSYICVSRSVWENDESPELTCNNNMLRSEMLLGVQLIRPCSEGCELTTITHVYSPGVPEQLAKRMAPTSAATLLKEIQSVFRK